MAFDWFAEPISTIAKPIYLAAILLPLLALLFLSVRSKTKRIPFTKTFDTFCGVCSVAGLVVAGVAGLTIPVHTSQQVGKFIEDKSVTLSQSTETEPLPGDTPVDKQLSDDPPPCPEWATDVRALKCKVAPDSHIEENNLEYSVGKLKEAILISMDRNKAPKHLRDVIAAIPAKLNNRKRFLLKKTLDDAFPNIICKQ